MQLVNEGNECRRRQYDEQDMAHEEVRTPKRHLYNLDDVFARGLRQRGRAKTHAVPFTRPPRTVSLIMFEFSREED